MKGISFFYSPVYLYGVENIAMHASGQNGTKCKRAAKPSDFPVDLLMVFPMEAWLTATNFRGFG